MDGCKKREGIKNKALEQRVFVRSDFLCTLKNKEAFVFVKASLFL